MAIVVIGDRKSGVPEPRPVRRQITEYVNQTHRERVWQAREMLEAQKLQWRAAR